MKVFQKADIFVLAALLRTRGFFSSWKGCPGGGAAVLENVIVVAAADCLAVNQLRMKRTIARLTIFKRQRQLWISIEQQAFCSGWFPLLTGGLHYGPCKQPVHGVLLGHREDLRG